jgi:hypothetical protein
VLIYGVQANDPPFAQALQGLAMLASIDPATITDRDAYRVWVDEAVKSVLDGVEGIIGIEARVGTQQRTVQETILRQEDLRMSTRNPSTRCKAWTRSKRRPKSRNSRRSLRRLMP